jgi:nicotinamide phosphoribosyltransferase
MRKNIILDTDFYKLCHPKALKPGITGMYEYIENRIGKQPIMQIAGIGAIIHEHFLNPVTQEMIDEAVEESIMGGGYNLINEEVWQKVMKLGYLPLRIKALPEGTIIRGGTAYLTVEETEEWFAPFVGQFEALFQHSWSPSAVATRSFLMKKNIKPYYELSCDNLNNLDFAVNDFGFRGDKWYEAAAMDGFGHLINFPGSDNIAASRAVIKDIYGYKGRLKSVWATEHSVAMSFGRNHELDYVMHQLNNAPDNAHISIVIDAFDQDNFVKEIACHPDVIAKQASRTGRLIWRPDTGDKYINIPKYSDIVAAANTYHINRKGYKVINNNTGFIQGDDIDETVPNLYAEYTKAGWSADNLVTGSGGGLLVKGLTRDTHRIAMKPSQMRFGDEIVNVQKTPLSDPTKNSKLGRVKTTSSLHGFITIESGKMPEAQFMGYQDCLETIYENGVFVRPNFQDILNTANKFL